MKKYVQFLFPVLIVMNVVFLGCKKKKPTNNDNSNPGINCNLSSSTLVVNDTLYNIISDTGYATLNNTYNTEHIISAGQGCSIEFEGTVPASEGTFAITPIFTDVIPGSHKVYMQYFINGISFLAQSGSVTVKGSGTGATLEFCKIKFKESFGEEKTVSMKSDSE